MSARLASSVLVAILVAGCGEGEYKPSPDVGKSPAEGRVIDECRYKQPEAENGDKPPQALVARLITCLWERPANPGMDGAMTVDIFSLKVGSSRDWAVESDIGAGDIDTEVWPVKVHYAINTFYRTSTQVAEGEAIFNCFVTTFNEWGCGLGQRIRDFPGKSIPVPGAS